ncbi:hypothetical protein F4810DRAFT_140009 [Camillea tinctor]|nr:hypothetical protein F4810DRAFT_140009 [Camillea tinctor]
MSSSSPTPTPDVLEAKAKFLHAVAIGGTPLALIALFLPPRRLDLRAGILGGFAVWGTNQLAYEYSGRSFAQRFGGRMEALAGTGELSERAKMAQRRIREEKRRREVEEGKQGEGEGVEEVKGDGDGDGVKKDKERGLVKRIWMGDQPDDWRERRDRREKEALSEGGDGYWGLITEQVMEVFTKGGKGGEKEKKDDGEKKSSS